MKPSTRKFLYVLMIGLTVSCQAEARRLKVHIHIGGDVAKVWDREVKRGLVEHTTDAISEAVQFSGNVVESQFKGMLVLAEQVAQGNIAHGIGDWSEVAIRDGVTRNAFESMSDSSYLHGAALLGAGSYNPWAAGILEGVYVQHLTGSTSEGLKAGAILGASGAALSGIGNSQSLHFTQKALYSSIVVGTAASLSGADSTKVQQAMVMGAATSLTQSALTHYQQQQTTAAAASEPATCKATKYAYCSPFVDDRKVDIRKMSATQNHTGMESTLEQLEHPFALRNQMNEGSFAMTAVNKAPGVQAFSFTHDVLMQDYPFLVQKGLLQATIVPVAVVSYVSLGVLDTATITEQLEAKQKPDSR